MIAGAIAHAPRTDALDLACAATSYLKTLLDRQGKLESVDGKLLAGGVDLSNNTALVEKVKSELGFGCSIFHGDVRIACTAVDKVGGERAVGLRANERTTQQVYRCGVRQTGITHILGQDWVLVYVPLRDHRDKIVGMLAAYRELTHFLHDLCLLDHAPEALIVHSPSGRVVDANRTACDMLALSRHELLDKSMHEFTTASEQALRAAWAEIGDEPTRVESFWRRSDVFEFAVELLVSRVTVAGQPLLLTVARDFTKPHAARQRLQALSAQLVQSEKMAALGKLVAGVTHDVNTPLGVIRSGYQTIAKAADKLRETLGEHHPAALETRGVERSMRTIERSIDTARAGADRLNAVVQRLRSFSHLDEGSLQDVSLRTCVEEVLTLVAHRVPESVNVTSKLQDSLRLRCRPAQLNHLIMNLLVNAIEAVGDAGTITICASADDGHVALVVEDDGEGIAAADLPNIFNPGFTTKGVGVGGGLGLAIAYQVAEDHGGSILVDSSLGAGARFTTRLPLRGIAAKGTSNNR